TTSLYTFLLANGGTIISTTDSTATVVWQLTPGGPFTIKVTEVVSSGCVGMDSLNVIIRGSDPIACIDHLNLSIDNACGTVVHSGMILVGEAPGDMNYTVIIRDQNGNIIPNATFTYEHVGQTFNVMVLSDCSGQSCWGKVTVEDKFPPVINCVCPEDNANSMCTITCREIEQFIAGNIPPELRPTVVDNCGGVTLEIINTNLDFSYCANGSIQVTWKATDASGNMSTCRQVFGIVPLTLETLTFPKDYIGVCNGSSDPSVTGFPQVGGIDLDLPGGLCNISVMYQDEVIQLCGNGIKILRRWTVRDWCTGQTRVFGQTILLSDHEGPVLVCVANMQVSTDLYNCYANVLVPKPAATDSCSKVTGFQLFSHDGTVVKVGNNFIINGLPQGVHSVKWVVTDECGNTSSCNVNITVVDDVPPIVSCQSRTIIGLTNERSNGITLVPASVFSDGSFDNCGPVSFRARRMDSCIDFDWTTGGACVDEIPGGFPAVNGKDRGTDRSTCVPFACCDVNNGLIMVELEVSDASGNLNYCMVEVQVQDKLAPTIICPPDITLSCDFLQDIHLGTFTDISGNNDGSLDEDPLSGLFGNVYDAFNHIPSDRKNIIINDPNNTYYPQPHTFGIEGWANDNCQVDLQVTVTEINDCSGASLPFNPPHNARRLIERRFRAFDGVTAGTCLQLIWIVDFSPFFITDSTCLNENPNDGVIWPCDVLLNTCPQDLSGTGEPVLFDDGCSIIGVSHEDHRFNFSDSACYKVLREWKVIDWCQFNPATGAGFWTYTQVIKVFDGIAPVFVNCPQAPVQLCTDDPGISIPANNQIFLGENNPDATSCSVHVIMTQRVHEDCSEMIFYDVKYYPFNGTSFIQIVPTTSTTLNADHEVDISFNTQLSSIPSIQQNGLPYNSPLCGDYHRVVWTVEDGCGNQTICDYLFRLEDCKDPTPVLIDGLSTAIMGPLGTVTISASNFNASSNDDCTPGDELLFSFSGTSYEPTFTYTCDNVPVFGQPFDVTIWVADGGSDLNCNGQIEWSERNTAFSTTTLVITDPNNVCGQLQSSLTGEILTDHQDAVEKVIVNLSSPQQLFPAYTTSGDGKFVFSGIPAGLDYTITPQRNDDYKNGVSTLDLVGIQKHLLGKEIFTSPYQYIAADANNSRSVSALDLIELRKLILGIIPVLPNNDSWRFLDKNTVIPDPSDPWLFNENLYIQHWSGQSAQNDFIAVKVGDINNSVKANAQQLLPRGDRRVMDIMAETKEMAKEGEIIELKLTLPEIVSGFQWTLETDGFEYVGVNSGDVQIDDSNIGLLGNGITTMSWNGDVLSDGSPKNEVHIIMRWKAIASGKIKNRIRLTSLMTPAESYTPSGEILEVKLTYANLEVASDFNLYQNKPNPWNGQTTIGFDLPEDGSARLTIFDVTGQMVANFEKYFKAGYNTIVLSEKEMHATGVLYYRLESGGNSASKKMVLIR
ncbi:MAG: T9SS type A sorting domain-containing protein, partial [Saprospiraceae bacterium]